MNKFFTLFGVLVTAAVGCATVAGDVTLPDVIGSSMVLQQKQAVPIWGTADAGEAVTVSFGKIKKTIVANGNGKWHIDLGKLSANSSPQTMTIAGKNTIILSDILVGEVWLVAGQSNMQRLLRETDNGEAVQAAANHPNIRLFNVSREGRLQKAIRQAC
jgi:sialate O-acetylesterase